METSSEDKSQEKFTPAPALKTFRNDVAETVQKEHVSVVKMALAENSKREEANKLDLASSPVSSKNLSLIIGSVVLVVIALGTLGYFYFKSNTPPPSVPAQPIQTDLIFSESTKIIATKDFSSKNLETVINSIRDVQLPLGSIQKIQIGEVNQITTSKFFETLHTRMPPDLARSIDEKFLLGMHAFTENEPFLILSINNHDAAYAGMLAWEKDLKDDIGFLFIKPKPVPTEAATTTESFINPPKLAFQDKVIENKDTRVLISGDGEILLFYTFVDKDTLVLTTNSYTLKEIIIRFNKQKLTN